MRTALCILATLAMATGACSVRKDLPETGTEAQMGAADAAIERAAANVAKAVNEGTNDHPEARLYDASIDADRALDQALARAKEGRKSVLVIMGANWCHDSRALAGWMVMPRFRQLVADKYELLFVNVGQPQTKDGHNLGIARRYGIEIEGTPTVLILSPDGKLLNKDTAPTWRNAASRSEDEIFDELENLAATPEGSPR